MIDSLKNFLINKSNSKPKYKNFNGILTLHRPENVDTKKRLKEIIYQIKKWTKKIKFFFLYIQEPYLD